MLSCVHQSSYVASSWSLLRRWLGILHMGCRRPHLISPYLEGDLLGVLTSASENGYPRRFIHQSASTPSCPPLPREAIAGGSENLKATVCLPYVRGVSEQLKRVLKDLQIRTVMRLHRTLRTSWGTRGSYVRGLMNTREH